MSLPLKQLLVVAGFVLAGFSPMSSSAGGVITDGKDTGVKPPGNGGGTHGLTSDSGATMPPSEGTGEEGVTAEEQAQEVFLYLAIANAEQGAEGEAYAVDLGNDAAAACNGVAVSQLAPFGILFALHALYRKRRRA